VYSSLWEPVTELRSVTCHMESHSIAKTVKQASYLITCHLCNCNTI